MPKKLFLLGTTGQGDAELQQLQKSVLYFSYRKFGSREEDEVSGFFVFSHIRMIDFLG